MRELVKLEWPSGKAKKSPNKGGGEERKNLRHTERVQEISAYVIQHNFLSMRKMDN